MSVNSQDGIDKIRTILKEYGTNLAWDDIRECGSQHPKFLAAVTTYFNMTTQVFKDKVINRDLVIGANDIDGIIELIERFDTLGKS